MKLIDEMIDEIPAMWSEKINKSTELELWNSLADRGGYIVHPVPIIFLFIIEWIIKFIDIGSNQKLRLLVRGKAISWELTIKGISQFPNPPIISGITVKKIIIIAWDVTIEL